MTITNLTDFFAMRQRNVKRRRSEPTYTTVRVENMSLGDLVHRLRGTGLTVSNRHDMLVLHITGASDERSC